MNENSSNISFMPQQVNRKLDRFQELNLTDLKRVIAKDKCRVPTVKMIHFQ